MQVSVETTGTLGRKLTIELPAEKVESQIQSRLRSLSKTVKLDGFRPGKVPLKVVQSRYGQQIEAEVMQQLVESSLQEALEKEELRPVSGPKILPKAVEKGKSFSYTAEFEVLPEITIASLDGVSVKKLTAEVVDKDIDDMLENFQSQKTTFEPVDRAAQNGDQIVIDFEGKIDGVAFESGSGSDVPIVLGTRSMIEGFEEQLAGVKAGEEKVLDVTFPEDYPGTEVAGKQAIFETRVISVSAPKIPEIDEDFVKTFGIEDGSLDKLKVELRGNMERELAFTLKTKLRTSVMEMLAEKNAIEAPSAMVEEQSKALFENAKQQNRPARNVSDFSELAKQRVIIGLVTSEILKQNNIQIDQDRVAKTITEMADSYDEPEKIIQWYQTNQEAKNNVEAMVLEEQVVDWVLAQVTVEEEKMTFSEVMKR